MTEGPELRIEPFDAADTSPVRDVLVTAYGEDRFGEDWLAWKHREGPWGASTIYVAWLGDEAICTFFVLPWRVHGPNGEVAAARLVDGGTTPAARGRGALQALTRFGRERWQAEQPSSVAFATATPTAQRVHIRNGATAFEPVDYAYDLVRPAKAGLVDGWDVLAGYVHPDGLATAWDAASLRWRYDARSGQEVRVVALRESEGAGAIIRRSERGRLAVLIVEVAWGPPEERAALLRAVAREERAVVTLAPSGPGAGPGPRGRLRRGDSLVCMWDLGAGDRLAPRDPLRRDDWAFSYADLGGVI